MKLSKQSSDYSLVYPPQLSLYKLSTCLSLHLPLAPLFNYLHNHQAFVVTTAYYKVVSLDSIIVDRHGIILAWYLLGVLSDSRQMGLFPNCEITV